MATVSIRSGIYSYQQVDLRLQHGVILKGPMWHSIYRLIKCSLIFLVLISFGYLLNVYQLFLRFVTELIYGFGCERFLVKRVSLYYQRSSV